jgi:hypothetical protein
LTCASQFLVMFFCPSQVISHQNRKSQVDLKHCAKAVRGL